MSIAHVQLTFNCMFVGCVCKASMESCSICHLVAHDCKEEFLPTRDCSIMEVWLPLRDTYVQSNYFQLDC